MAEVDTSALAGVLSQLEARGKNVRGILPIVGEMLIAAVSDVYEAEGPGWPGLAESTIAARRGGGAGAKILRDTGVMAGSTGVELGDSWAEASAGVSYADFHAKGTSRMPKRNPFDLGPFEAGVLDDVAALLAAEVVG